jgi:hypothetical protein
MALPMSAPLTPTNLSCDPIVVFALPYELSYKLTQTCKHKLQTEPSIKT